jgi:hypothetical protein
MKSRQVRAVIERADVRNFQDADEVREFPNGRLELVTVGGVTIGRATLYHGWKWSESVQPIVKTDSCEMSHLQYQLSGVMRVRMDDGTEFESRAGDVTFFPPGHDAWVVGDEPVVVVDFQGMREYAQLT